MEDTEQCLRSVLDGAPDAIYVTDMEYHLLYMNQAAQTIWEKIFRKNMQGDKCYQALLGRTEPCPFCKLRNLRADEFTVRNFSGATGRIFEMQGKLIDWGGIPAHIEYVRDVTAIKSVEKRSEELAAQQKDLYEHIGIGMCLFRYAGGAMQAVICNQAYRQLLQLPEEFDTGENIPWKSMYFASEDQDALYQSFVAHIHAGKPFQRILHVNDKQAGQPKSILMNMECVPQTDGSALWYVSAYDVTAWEENEQRLNSVLHTIDGGIAIYKTDSLSRFIPIMYTDGIAQMHGYTRQEYDEVTGRDVLGMVLADDREYLKNAILTAIPQKSGLSITYRGIHKEKGFVWINLSASPIGEDADGCMRYSTILTAASREFELYQKLVNLSENGLVVSDPQNGEVYFANEAAKPLLEALRTAPRTGGPAPKKMLVNGRHYQVDSHPFDWMGRNSLAQYFSDISEEVELQEQISFDENRYRSVVEQSQIAFWDYDLIKGTVYCNDLFKRYAAAPDSSTGFFDTHFRLANVHPADRGKLAAFCRDIEKNKLGVAHQIRLKTQDGSYRWSELHGLVMDDLKGNCIRKICFIRDIDDETKQYMDLQARFDYEIGKQNVFEEDVVERLLIDLTDNKVLQATDQNKQPVYRMIGLSVERLLALRLTRTQDGQERAALTGLMDRKALLDTYLRVEFPELEMKASVPHITGKQYFHTYVRCVKNPKNEHIVATFVTKNVDKIRTEEIMMRRLLETNYNWVILVHAGTGKIKIRYSNGDAGFASGIRASYDELILGNIRTTVVAGNQEQVLHEMKLSTIKRELLRTGQCSGRATTMKDGAQCFTTWTAAYFDDEKEYILITSADVTEVYKRDLKKSIHLAKALEDAQVASKAKTTFLARMSHEIRTPITTISSILDLIRQDCVKNCMGADALLARIDTASTANRYLLTLINDILDIAKVESNELAIHAVPTHIESFVEPVLAMVTPLAEEKHIRFISEWKNHAIEWCKLDPVRVTQILMNLLNNAVKFTPEGGTIRFTREITNTGGDVATAKFIVSDTGMGISPEFMADIFKPFKQEYSDSKSRYGGTGIGLSISRSLARLMGGDITVESEKGKGATFIVTMKWDIVAPQEDMQALASEEDMRLDGVTVLLCEDHPTNQMIAEQLLLRQGCTVIKADDGREGVDLFAASATGDIDFILMDVRMPNMDGLEATQAIRNLNRPDAKTVPIVAMSANAFEEDRQQSLNAGMNDHLSKPVEPEVLYRTIRKHIATTGLQ